MATRVEPKTKSEAATAALRFARRVHLGQHRKQTHEQFVEHPIAVVRLLSDAGFDGPIITAAYLHDVVEKTSVGSDEIRERFGDEVSDIVEALSEDTDLADYQQRKRDLRTQVLASSRNAIVIYSADRVANMRDWSVTPAAERDRIAARLGTALMQRLELWAEDLVELTRYDPRLPFLAEIEIELGALRREASSQSA